MRKSAEEYFRYLAVNPRDHAWGLCITGAGYQPSAPGVAGVPRRRHPPGHYYSWETGRMLNEYAVVYVTHGQGEFDSQATGLRQRQQLLDLHLDACLDQAEFGEDRAQRIDLAGITAIERGQGGQGVRHGGSACRGASL